ncbi:MAG: M18 family aminopeptidase, partial [Muribaculaceae bacterium]|nr:M18 family aminopeptidase [Muribaculaceae bacterium]
TLGNILTSQLPLRGVDMGAPLWAMHSCRETASTSDHVYITDAFCEFFSL